MSKLVGVPAIALDGVWAHVAPFVVKCLQKAKEHRVDADDIRAMLAARDLQLWIVLEDKKIKTVVITEIHEYPKAKECLIFLASGEYPEDWAEITDGVIAWAKSMGCTHMGANMRRGLVKRMGWEERQTYCMRVIE